MVENKKPCFGCTKRQVTRDYNCHSHCPDFLGLKEENMARAEVIRQKKAEETMMIDVREKSIKRIAKDKKKTYAWRDK